MFVFYKLKYLLLFFFSLVKLVNANGYDTAQRRSLLYGPRGSFAPREQIDFDKIMTIRRVRLENTIRNNKNVYLYIFFFFRKVCDMAEIFSSNIARPKSIAPHTRSAARRNCPLSLNKPLLVTDLKFTEKPYRTRTF